MSGFSKEPQRLHAEQQRIEKEIVDVAVNQHEAFTHSAEVSQVVAVKINTARKASSRALTALETLRQQSASIVQYGQTWRQEKRTANDAVTNHPKLMELLEAPSTLELCIRSEMYLEAVLVIERIADAVKKYPESITLQDVLDQCMRTLRKMLQHIVGSKLCGTLNVSQAVKTVSFLQQMGIPEKQVRQLFIEQRTVFIEQLLEEARSLASTPYSYLSKILGVYKLQVADVVSQCLACFSGSTKGGGGSSSQQSSPTSVSSPTTNNNAGEPSSGFRDALHVACQAWSTRLVQEYQSFVPQIASSTELHSLAEQTGHCCSLLSKVGLDVGSVLAHILSSHVAETVSASLALCYNHFQTELSTFSWKNAGSHHSSGVADRSRMKHGAGGSQSNPLHKQGSSSSGRNTPAGGVVIQQDGEEAHNIAAPSADHPPMHLMEFLPLAVALNGVCSIFNDVRKAVTASAVPRCILSVQQLLEKMVDEIIAANPTPASAAAHNSKKGKSGAAAASTSTSSSASLSTSHEHNNVYCRFSKSFQHDFLPHILFATEQAFGGGGQFSSVLADHLQGATESLVLPLKAFVSQAVTQERAEASQAASAQKQRDEKSAAAALASSTTSSVATGAESPVQAGSPTVAGAGAATGLRGAAGGSSNRLSSNHPSTGSIDEISSSRAAPNSAGASVQGSAAAEMQLPRPTPKRSKLE